MMPTMKCVSYVQITIFEMLEHAHQELGLAVCESGHGCTVAEVSEGPSLTTINNWDLLWYGECVVCCRLKMADCRVQFEGVG